MMDLMYRLPSDDTIASCTITPEVITEGADPILTYRDAPEAQPEKKRSFSLNNLLQ